VQIGRVVKRRISSKRKKILSIDAGWAPWLRRWQCQITLTRLQAEPIAVEIIRCGLDQNLAKVGGEGSNPFARSNFTYVSGRSLIISVS
jgi:hypothetical protein